jgi:hypothetical protein
MMRRQERDPARPAARGAAGKGRPAAGANRGLPPVPRLLGLLDRRCERHARLLLALMMAAWAGLFSYHAWLKYRYYLYSDIDLPLFVQAVDGILHGTLYSSIRALYWLGDHSSLILFLVAPLYPSPATR